MTWDWLTPDWVAQTAVAAGVGVVVGSLGTFFLTERGFVRLMRRLVAKVGDRSSTELMMSQYRKKTGWIYRWQLRRLWKRVEKSNRERHGR